MAVVKVGEKQAEVPADSLLQRVCDEHRLPVVFGCRQGRCGSCLVQVQAGSDNLRVPSAREARTLEVLDAEPDWRLACQCVVMGDVHLCYI
jgi:ferredoxin